MKLTAEQEERIKLERGICANEVCDGCHALLGPARFTRYGQPGEWCSRECRDGAEAVKEYGRCLSCGVSLAGGRKGRLYCGDACRKRSNRKNNPESPIQNKPLTGSKMASLAYPPWEAHFGD